MMLQPTECLCVVFSLISLKLSLSTLIFNNGCVQQSTCNIPGILTSGFIKLIPASSLFEPQQSSSTAYTLRYKGAVL